MYQVQRQTKRKPTLIELIVLVFAITQKDFLGLYNNNLNIVNVLLSGITRGEKRASSWNLT